MCQVGCEKSEHCYVTISRQQVVVTISRQLPKTPFQSGGLTVRGIFPYSQFSAYSNFSRLHQIICSVSVLTKNFQLISISTFHVYIKSSVQLQLHRYIYSNFSRLHQIICSISVLTINFQVTSIATISKTSTKLPESSTLGNSIMFSLKFNS